MGMLLFVSLFPPLFLLFIHYYYHYYPFGGMFGALTGFWSGGREVEGGGGGREWARKFSGCCNGSLSLSPSAFVARSGSVPKRAPNVGCYTMAQIIIPSLFHSLHTCIVCLFDSVRLRVSSKWLFHLHNGLLPAEGRRASEGFQPAKRVIIFT